MHERPRTQVIVHVPNQRRPARLDQRAQQVQLEAVAMNDVRANAAESASQRKAISQRRRRGLEERPHRRPAGCVSQLRQPSREGLNHHLHSQLARRIGERTVFAEQKPQLPIRLRSAHACEHLAQARLSTAQAAARTQVKNCCHARPLR